MPEEVVRNTSFSGGIAKKYQFIHSFFISLKKSHLEADLIHTNVIYAVLIIMLYIPWIKSIWPVTTYYSSFYNYCLSWDIVCPLLSRAWRLNCGHACASGRVDEAVSGRKPLAGKGVVGLLSWHGSHFWVCITFCKVRHGDNVTKPDYYYSFFNTPGPARGMYKKMKSV